MLLLPIVCAEATARAVPNVVGCDSRGGDWVWRVAIFFIEPATNNRPHTKCTLKRKYRTRTVKIEYRKPVFNKNNVFVVGKHASVSFDV